MQEKYNVTGMTCSACQARVQKSVSSLTGVQECNVNLLKNSMVVTYDDKNVNSGQIIAAREKGRLWSIPTAGSKGKSAVQAVSPVDTAKKEYEAMRRRVIWSFVFTIPLFLSHRRKISVKQTTIKQSNGGTTMKKN
ncbi:MAG: cation transporter [Blautia faecis]